MRESRNIVLILVFTLILSFSCLLYMWLKLKFDTSSILLTISINLSTGVVTSLVISLINYFAFLNNSKKNLYEDVAHYRIMLGLINNTLHDDELLGNQKYELCKDAMKRFNIDYEYFHITTVEFYFLFPWKDKKFNRETKRIYNYTHGYFLRDKNPDELAKEIEKEITEIDSYMNKYGPTLWEELLEYINNKMEDIKRMYE